VLLLKEQMNNRFLNDFIEMRKQIYQSAVQQSVVPIKGKKSVDSLKKAPAPDKEITLAYIIENKPSNDKVIDYLKMRAEELLAEEDD